MPESVMPESVEPESVEPESVEPESVEPESVEPESGPADGEFVDVLPEDLDLSGFVGPQTFPNNNRRRIPAALYLAFGIGAVALYAALGESSALVNLGTLWAGVGLVAFGAYGMIAGWTLKIDESDALVSASAEVGFPVGHAAAQMAWRGWFSRPTWRILAYSNENPPTKRGIVLVDGVNGQVIEGFSEENPEDWTEFHPDDVEGLSLNVLAAESSSIDGPEAAD
ncbi:MAG: hypothetical protein WD029_08505 [Microthrixaceae bacterium]